MAFNNPMILFIFKRYGDEAGELANDTALATGSAAMTVWNVQQLGPKSMAKKVAKDTGKQVIKNYKDKKPPNSRGDDTSPANGPAAT